MKLGVVSDVHSNHAGLVRALELMGPVDELLCLGDCIFDYRFCNDTVALLKERASATIRGNHEEAFFGPAGERARSRPGNDPALMRWLAARPDRLVRHYDGVRIMLVHSTPWEPGGEYVLPHSPELARFGEADADVVLYGHTHRQLVRRVGDVLVVNPGSVGDGRDPANARQLSFAIIDTATCDVRITDFPDPRRGR